MQILIFIPLLVLYILAFRVVYTQFKLAKLLKVNGFDHTSAFSIFSHKNIQLARKYAKQLDDKVLCEQLLSTARQFENSRGNLITFLVLFLIIFIVYFRTR